MEIERGVKRDREIGKVRQRERELECVGRGRDLEYLGWMQFSHNFISIKGSKKKT